MMNSRKQEFLTWLRESGIIDRFLRYKIFLCFSNVVDQVSLDLHSFCGILFLVHVYSVHIQALFLVERMLYNGKIYYLVLGG